MQIARCRSVSNIFLLADACMSAAEHRSKRAARSRKRAVWWDRGGIRKVHRPHQTRIGGYANAKIWNLTSIMPVICAGRLSPAPMSRGVSMMFVRNGLFGW